MERFAFHPQMYINIHICANLAWRFMGKRFRGSRLIGWGLSERVVARFQDFCEAKDRSPAYVQMEKALDAYMNAADPEIKKEMEVAKRKRLAAKKKDDAANIH